MNSEDHQRPEAGLPQHSGTQDSDPGPADPQVHVHRPEPSIARQKLCLHPGIQIRAKIEYSYAGSLGSGPLLKF